MGYQLVTVPASRQALRKLPEPVRRHLVNALQVLTLDPYRGEPLERPFRGFRSFHTKYENTQYRVVYEVNETHHEVIIRYAASRENFYKELRRLRLKPVV